MFLLIFWIFLPHDYIKVATAKSCQKVCASRGMTALLSAGRLKEEQRWLWPNPDFPSPYLHSPSAGSDTLSASSGAWGVGAAGSVVCSWGMLRVLLMVFGGLPGCGVVELLGCWLFRGWGCCWLFCNAERKRKKCQSLKWCITFKQMNRW